MNPPAVLDERTIRELREPLLAFIRRRVSDPTAAEDLVQEVLIKVLAGWRSLRDEESLRPWAYRIARNAVFDHYRGTRPTTELDSVEEQPTEADDPDANDNQLVGAWLRGWIEHLSPDKREAVWLADVEGLKRREIAERMGISLSGAKSRVQRGRAELRELLEACCHIELDRRGNAIDWRKQQPHCCD